MLELNNTHYDALHEMQILDGPDVIWIFIPCVIMWSIVLERYRFCRHTLRREVELALARWQARADKLSWSSRQIRTAMISRLNSAMNSKLGVLRVLVPMCPLLGLLGTV